jgi:glycogen debranching enzyme
MKSPAVQEIIDEAKRVLYGNLKTGFCRWAGTEYKYIAPAEDHYPHQWLWDSCFHAIVLSHFDIELAKNEIRNLLKIQRPDGFVPHMIFWESGVFGWRELLRPLESKPSFSPKTSQLIQPPLLAEAVEAIYKKEKEVGFLYEILPKLSAYYKWLTRERDPDGDGLISIIAPYESGMDQSPSYDPVLGLDGTSAILASLAGRTVTLRNLIHGYNLKKIFAADYFNVEDVMVNSIYIKNLQILSRLLHEIDNEETAREFHQLAAKAKESLIKKCYEPREGFFYDRYGAEEKAARVKTIKGLFPLILDLPKTIVKRLVREHLFNRDEFDLPFAVPTVARSEKGFSAAPVIIAKEPIIWRGPTWINTNWYIMKGLRHHGFEKEAKKLGEKSVDLIRQSGYREFFNPFTGEGYGAHNFGWSTLVVDMLLS